MEKLINNKIQIAGKIEDSLVNGDGMRMVIFVSGCKHNCKGCHNKPMQDFNYGDEWDIDELFNYVKDNCNLIDGITFSGGDPFEWSEQLTYLAKRIKTELKLNIWSYTGYTIEQINESNDKNKIELLHSIDTLVDGMFEIDNMTDALKYTGSANQRIIYLNNGNIEKILKSKKYI